MPAPLPSEAHRAEVPGPGRSVDVARPVHHVRRSAPRRAGPVALLLLLLAAPVGAQVCGQLDPGDHVRLGLRARPPAADEAFALPPGDVIEGILVRIDLEAVVVDVEGRPIEIPRWYVESVEERCRPDGGLGPGSSALVGGLIGGVLAGAVAACFAENEGDKETGTCHPDRNPDAVGKSAVVGLVVGGLIGLAAGSIRTSPSWTSVPLELQVVPGGGGRWEIGLRLPLGGG